MSRIPNIGIVIVSYGHEDVIGQLLDDLAAQMQPDDRIAVVDNHPEHRSEPIARRHPRVSHVIASNNHGFASGCNQGVNAIGDSVNLIFLLNPDTHISRGMLTALRKNASGDFDAWMPLLLLPNGRVNSAGNVVHISGLSWCGGYGMPSSDYTRPQAVHVLSGACLMIRRATWQLLGGMSEEYFLYHEDTDFSTRMLLRGLRLGLTPNGHVFHDYDYAKSKTKWLYMERNRPLYILRTWPGPVIAVLLPHLLVVELSLWPISLLQGRFWLKTRSLGMTIVALPWALKSRREIQASRTIGSYEFLLTLTPEINTPLLPKAVTSSNAINATLRTYYKMCRSILKVFAPAPPPH